MPTYEYACKACSERLEVVQAFSDDPLTECPSCGGPLRKVFSAVGIAFKGSGFYKNDSRASNGKKTGSSSDGTSTSTSTDAPTTKSDAKSDTSAAPSSTTPSTSTPAPASTPASSTAAS